MEDVSDYFIHKVITKVVGKPTRDEIKRVLEQAQENAAAVPCELGGGNHGYLGITMTATEYLNVASVEFINHTNPGSIPTIADTATQSQIAMAKEQHKKRLELFKEQRFLERAIRSQVVNAFEETYLIDLKQDHIGYNNVSIPNMFKHLNKYYGKITDADLLANKTNMSKPWDPDTPIQIIYKQIDEGTKFASLVSVHIPDKEKTAIGYQLVHNTGELTAACRDWRKTSDNLKSWTTFKEHFTAEYQDYKDDNKQTGTAAYKANQMVVDEYQQVLTQVQEEATRDESVIQDLKCQNENLLCQMTKKSDEVSELKSLVRDMKDLVSKLTYATSRRREGAIKQQKYYCYCWTHGKTGKPEHTSQTCTNKADNHVKTATIADRKGGSARYCE